jgi:endonuclease-3 related protein
VQHTSQGERLLLCRPEIEFCLARIAVRHRLIAPGADYEQLKYLFESNLPPCLLSKTETGDTKLYNEFHALLVRLGKDFCKPKAKCPGCPLENLPHAIDIEYL